MCHGLRRIQSWIYLESPTKSSSCSYRTELRWCIRNWVLKLHTCMLRIFADCQTDMMLKSSYRCLEGEVAAILSNFNPDHATVSSDYLIDVDFIKTLSLLYYRTWASFQQYQILARLPLHSCSLQAIVNCRSHRPGSQAAWSRGLDQGARRRQVTGVAVLALSIAG